VQASYCIPEVQTKDPQAPQKITDEAVPVCVRVTAALTHTEQPGVAVGFPFILPILRLPPDPSST